VKGTTLYFYMYIVLGGKIGLYMARKLEKLRVIYLVTTIGIASVSQIFYHKGTPEIVLHVLRSHCLRKCLQAKNKEEFGKAGSTANCHTKIPEIFRRTFEIICGIYYLCVCVCVFRHIPRFLT
jgi:hypothetical protein